MIERALDRLWVMKEWLALLWVVVSGSFKRSTRWQFGTDTSKDVHGKDWR